MKERWENLSEEERAKWTAHSGNPDKSGRGFVEYYRKLRPAKVAKIVEIMGKPSAPLTPENRNANIGHAGRNPRNKGRDAREGTENWMPGGVCTMLAAHHELLKDDPERLSTQFLEELIGVDCHCKLPRNDWETIRAKEIEELTKRKIPTDFDLKEATMSIDEMFERLKR